MFDTHLCNIFKKGKSKLTNTNRYDCDSTQHNPDLIFENDVEKAIPLLQAESYRKLIEFLLKMGSDLHYVSKLGNTLAQCNIYSYSFRPFAQEEFEKLVVFLIEDCKFPGKYPQAACLLLI